MSSISLGILLTSIDIICFGTCKYIFINNLSQSYLIIPAIIYGLQIYIFYHGLKYSSISLLNIIWNVLSSILVAALGILYFKEVLTILQKIGAILGIISIILFSL